jgi:hypothetical protein
MQKTEKELRDYSKDHLHYEVSMLYSTAHALLHDPKLDEDAVAMNAFVESFATHARVLAVFLHPEAAKEFKTDVTSEDYVSDVAAWRIARGTVPVELKTVIERTAKQIAHLTMQREPRGSSLKVWRPEPILRAFENRLALFLAHANASRLDPEFTTLAHSKLAPAATAAAPSRASASTSEVVVTAVSSVAAKPIRTDVSTPGPLKR